MATEEQFEYVNETSIAEDLLCPICTNPLREPVCSDQCGHTFCRSCITSTYKNLTSCPTCRAALSLEDYRPITVRPFLNQLNQLLVKCNDCSTSNIQRGDFNEHLKRCVAAKSQCAAVSLGCQWQGKRIELQSHVKECELLKIKPYFDRLTIQVQEQAKQIQFLHNILSKISENHKEACKEEYPDSEACCDLCEDIYNIGQATSVLHFCPQTDICARCLKQHFNPNL